MFKKSKRLLGIHALKISAQYKSSGRMERKLQRERYGRVFMDSLPPYRVTQRLDGVREFFK